MKSRFAAAFCSYLVSLLTVTAVAAQNTEYRHRRYGPTCGGALLSVSELRPRTPVRADVWARMPTNWGTRAFIGLGFNEQRVAMPRGCTLLVVPSWVFHGRLTAGHMSVALMRIPDTPVLKGLKLYAQATYTDRFSRQWWSAGQEMTVLGSGSTGR